VISAATARCAETPEPAPLDALPRRRRARRRPDRGGGAAIKIDLEDVNVHIVISFFASSKSRSS
jgi:hypothetical protein